ncbi:MAG TPA: nickel-binding protein [Chitinophagaceae bacterium]|nr:nickel-binding protein [Chitinophagaceae bacterium]
MPLFMDLHKVDHSAVEEVKDEPLSREAVQNKYGVKYHQVWVNQESGTVFCLMEGPDKATCEAANFEAYGNISCTITEVENGFNKNWSFEKKSPSPTPDTAPSPAFNYSNILVASFHNPAICGSAHNSTLMIPKWVKNIVSGKIMENGGTEIDWESDDNSIALFQDPKQALACAFHIREVVMASDSFRKEIIVRIGLCAVQPITGNTNFVQDGIRLARCLGCIAEENQVVISSLVNKQCKDPGQMTGWEFTRSLNPGEEKFLTDLVRVTEDRLSDSQFTLNKLCREICVSRPQLYRKISALTGHSPHHFIKDFRMGKALELLKRRSCNIAEISFELGFSTPSYFTKCFSERFGCTPSEFSKALSCIKN